MPCGYIFNFYNNMIANRLLKTRKPCLFLSLRHVSQTTGSRNKTRILDKIRQVYDACKVGRGK